MSAAGLSLISCTWTTSFLVLLSDLAEMRRVLDAGPGVGSVSVVASLFFERGACCFFGRVFSLGMLMVVGSTGVMFVVHFY